MSSYTSLLPLKPPYVFSILSLVPPSSQFELGKPDQSDLGDPEWFENGTKPPDNGLSTVRINIL